MTENARRRDLLIKQMPAGHEGTARFNVAEDRWEFLTKPTPHGADSHRGTPFGPAGVPFGQREDGMTEISRTHTLAIMAAIIATRPEFVFGGGKPTVAGEFDLETPQGPGIAAWVAYDLFQMVNEVVTDEGDTSESAPSLPPIMANGWRSDAP